MSRANGTEWKAIRRGWCLGPAEFKAKRLEQLEGKLGPHHSGELKRETAEARAERIIREELKRLKWRKGELFPRPKSDLTKVAIAARLRRETTLPLPWIAARRHLEEPQRQTTSVAESERKVLTNRSRL